MSEEVSMPPDTGDREIICQRPNFVWERTIRGIEYRFAREGRIGLLGHLEVRRRFPDGWFVIRTFGSRATEDPQLGDQVEDSLSPGEWLENPEEHRYLVTQVDECGVMVAFNGDLAEECTFDWAWRHWGPLVKSEAASTKESA